MSIKRIQGIQNRLNNLPLIKDNSKLPKEEKTEQPLIQEPKPDKPSDAIPKALSDLLIKLQGEGCSKEELLDILKQLKIDEYKDEDNTISFRYGEKDYHLTYTTEEPLSEDEIAREIEEIYEKLKETILKEQEFEMQDTTIISSDKSEIESLSNQIDQLNMLLGRLEQKAQTTINKERKQEINERIKELQNELKELNARLDELKDKLSQEITETHVLSNSQNEDIPEEDLIAMADILFKYGNPSLSSISTMTKILNEIKQYTEEHNFQIIIDNKFITKLAKIHESNKNTESKSDNTKEHSNDRNNPLGLSDLNKGSSTKKFNILS